MKLLRHLLTSVCILTIAAVHAAGQPSPSPLPPAFVMSIACFSDTIVTKPEWIFVLGGTAFRSLDALKAGIAHFPKGSTLTWRPSCKKIGGEPLSSEADLKAFEAHCASYGVHFIFIPGA